MGCRDEKGRVAKIMKKRERQIREDRWWGEGGREEGRGER